MVRNRLNQQELSKRSRKHWKNHFGSTSTKVERCREGQHGSCPRGSIHARGGRHSFQKGKKAFKCYGLDYVPLKSLC